MLYNVVVLIVLDDEFEKVAKLSNEKINKILEKLSSDMRARIENKINDLKKNKK